MSQEVPAVLKLAPVARFGESVVKGSPATARVEKGFPRSKLWPEIFDDPLCERGISADIVGEGTEALPAPPLRIDNNRTWHDLGGLLDAGLRFLREQIANLIGKIAMHGTAIPNEFAGPLVEDVQVKVDIVLTAID